MRDTFVPAHALETSSCENKGSIRVRPVQLVKSRVQITSLVRALRKTTGIRLSAPSSNKNQIETMHLFCFVLFFFFRKKKKKPSKDTTLSNRRCGNFLFSCADRRRELVPITLQHKESKSELPQNFLLVIGKNLINCGW